MIRQLEQQDLSRLREIFEANHDGEENFTVQGLGEEDGIYLSSLALTDDAGRIQVASLVAMTGEVVLFVDPEWKDRARWSKGVDLALTLEKEARDRGLDYVVALLPPRYANTWGKRLVRLGWERLGGWTPFRKELL